MIRKVTHVPLLVKNQDEALKWFTEKLGFVVRSDLPFPGGEGRWLTIAPSDQQDLEIVLQPPEWGLGDDESRKEVIGRTPGWVIATDDCRGDYELFQSRGVKFRSPPEDLPWGVSAVFEDLYGNSHNLLQPHPFDG